MCGDTTRSAAISAVLVMTLPKAGQGAASDRFFDALIGCAYAAIGYVLIGRWWPRSPLAGPYPVPLARARGAPSEL